MVRLQKLIELHPSAEAKQFAQFVPSQMAELELLERQRLEHAPLYLTQIAEAFGEIVGYVHRDIHAGHCTRPLRSPKARQRWKPAITAFMLASERGKEI